MIVFDVDVGMRRKLGYNKEVCNLFYYFTYIIESPLLLPNNSFGMNSWIRLVGSVAQFIIQKHKINKNWRSNRKSFHRYLHVSCRKPKYKVVLIRSSSQLNNQIVLLFQILLQTEAVYHK